MIPSVRLDGTNLLVFGGVLLIVVAGSWQFIGAYLLWALWQVVLYYLVMAIVALALYGALFVTVGGEDADAILTRNQDRPSETTTE